MLRHRERKPKAPPPITTRALVDQLAEGDPNEALSLGDLLDRFSERSFGVFLLVVMLPTFIPIPVGMGGISGALTSLIGLQFLARLEHPWLPALPGAAGNPSPPHHQLPQSHGTLAGPARTAHPATQPGDAADIRSHMPSPACC